MNNAILALDFLIALVNATVRIQTILATAQREGRDVTDEELKTLKMETDDLRDRWLKKN